MSEKFIPSRICKDEDTEVFVEKKSLADALYDDENFHFPFSGEVYKQIQQKQEFARKEKVVKDFLNQKVLPAIEKAIDEGNTFVCVDDISFTTSLSLELREVVFKFLELKNYKIYDRNLEHGDGLRFDIRL